MRKTKISLNKLSRKRTSLTLKEKMARYGFDFSNNEDYMREFKKRLMRKHSAELTDYYVRNHLKSRCKLKNMEIPDETIKKEREVIKAKRLIKKLKEEYPHERF